MPVAKWGKIGKVSELKNIFSNFLNKISSFNRTRLNCFHSWSSFFHTWLISAMIGNHVCFWKLLNCSLKLTCFLFKFFLFIFLVSFQGYRVGRKVRQNGPLVGNGRLQARHGETVRQCFTHEPWITSSVWRLCAPVPRLDSRRNSQRNHLKLDSTLIGRNCNYLSWTEFSLEWHLWSTDETVDCDLIFGGMKHEAKKFLWHVSSRMNIKRLTLTEVNCVCVIDLMWL